MKFITFTQAHKDKEVVINVDRIESFQEHNEGAVLITTERTHLVKQTPEEIKRLLGMQEAADGFARAYRGCLRGM